MTKGSATVSTTIGDGEQQSSIDIDRVLIERGALVVRSIGWLTLAVAIVTMIYDLTTTGSVFASAGWAGTSVALAMQVLLYWGRPVVAVAVFLWGMLSVAILAGFVVAGMRTPALYLLPVVIMMAGWLMGRRHGFIMAGAATAGLALIAWADSQGLLAAPLTRTPLALFIVYSGVVWIGAILGSASMARFRQEFQNAQELALDLAGKVSQLQISEQRFSTLFRSNPLPSAIVYVDGRLYEVNDAWEAMTGMARADVLGKRGIDLGVWADPSRFAELNMLIQRDGFIRGEPLSYKTTAGFRQFLLYCQPIRVDGEVLFINVMLDQTDRLAAERAQQEMNEKLEATIAERTEQLQRAQEELIQTERLASLGATVAGISHELNTPIGNVLSVASALQERANKIFADFTAGQIKKSELASFLESASGMSDLMQRSAVRAADLIASYKQVAIDQTSEQRRQFSVHAVVSDLLATMHPQFKHSPIKFELEIPDGMVCDSFPGPFSQIITNLLINAEIHAFEEREHGRVCIVAHEVGDEVVLTIKDDGAGMSEATLARIFDPFFTTKLGKGGSGLGLAICRRIATTVMAGALTVQSTLGVGTEFELRFPRIAPGRV